MIARDFLSIRYPKGEKPVPELLADFAVILLTFSHRADEIRVRLSPPALSCALRASLRGLAGNGRPRKLADNSAVFLSFQ